MKRSWQTLRLVLGDQLDVRHSWFEKTDNDVLYVVAEIQQEATYATHHIQKVCAFFLAMRAFASALEKSGHHVLHLELDDTAAYDTLPDLLRALIKRFGVERFEYQVPDEYRVAQQLAGFSEDCGIPTRVVDSEHFFVPRDAIGEYFDRDKSTVMEFFYRRVRRENKILMDGDQPLGDRWNFDAENRKKLPNDTDIPEPKLFSHDVSDIVARIQRHGIKTIGSVDAESLPWPCTRRQSLALLRFFLERCLADFGKYQDALTDRGWSLFHSRLSFSLNTKMLSPREVVARAIDHWEGNRDTITLAQLEGFVRQIIGWREFMRGIYWTHMPAYAQTNTLDHGEALPAFYWTGDTQMHCMATAIKQSLQHAYAHHIQRLMVTGNFALLLGVDPDAVDNWYLGIYIDAGQWVEITNTRGMSQYADGGIVATKPYVSSGKYIQRMGDHCKQCRYDIKQRTGKDACPFNTLYWDFLDRHRERFADNQRMRMMYANLDRIPAAEINAIRADAHRIRDNADQL